VLVLLAGVMLLLLSEGLVRLVDGGSHASVPTVALPHSVFRLPVDLDIEVALPGAEPARYRTDAGGARISPEAQSEPDSEILLVVGDSQALGWGIPHAETFGARAADRLMAGEAAARLLAGPSTDPERALYSLRGYIRDVRPTVGTALFTINLGNDLEEMFLGRREPRLRRWQSLYETLKLNSHLFDRATILLRGFESEDGYLPGINTALLALSPAERVLLARGVVDIVRAAREESAAERFIVVLIPNDYQYDTREFDKYRAQYDDPTLFETLQSNIPVMAAQMNTIHDYLRKSLRDEGMRVVDLLEHTDRLAPGRRLFDRYYHHISTEGHRILADAVIEAGGRNGDE
jgi:hypothetical protein